MVFAKEFLDLQFTFAERVQALSGMPLERALFEYTNLYVRFGLGREFDAELASWQGYVAGLRTARDGRQWTYRFYLEDAEATTEPSVLATFGCFSYAVEAGDRVRLHFRNRQADGRSPLGKACIAERREELEALFRHAKSTVAAGAVVVGISWLYNLEAYRRLLPPAYGASRRVAPTRFRSMALWGQFVNHHGQLKTALLQAFSSSLAEQCTLDGLEGCFPLRVLTTQAPIRDFFAFYAV